MARPRRSAWSMTADSAVRRSDDDERLGAIELNAERRAQRPGGNDPAIADAAAAVDDENREVLDQRRILKAVVHHDDAGAGKLREFRAGGAVAGDDGRREPRQQ